MRYVLVAFGLLVICPPALYVANDYRLKKKYERALSQIQIGDSKEAVTSLMGEPDERSWCYPPPTDHDTPEQKRLHEQCAEVYSYNIFLKSYRVAFDKENRVSGKGDTVSP